MPSSTLTIIVSVSLYSDVSEYEKPKLELPNVKQNEKPTSCPVCFPC